MKDALVLHLCWAIALASIVDVALKVLWSGERYCGVVTVVRCLGITFWQFG
jgi:hypothetical protein